VFIYQRPERAKALQQGMNSIQYIKMLLPLQGANTIRLALPRVSAHIVRLALGYVLLAFQAVPTQGVVSRCSPCPGLCAFGLSGRIFFIHIES
jgi:hypothetical protein